MQDSISNTANGAEQIDSVLSFKEGFSFRNLAGNWWYFLSAAALFAAVPLLWLSTFWAFCAAGIGILAHGYLAGRCRNIAGYLRSHWSAWKAVPAAMASFSAVYSYTFGYPAGYAEEFTAKIASIGALSPYKETVTSLLNRGAVPFAFLCGVLALPSLFTVFFFLYTFLAGRFRELRRSFSKAEKITAAVLGLLAAVFVVYEFTRAPMLYHFDIDKDGVHGCVYTGDTSFLVQTGAWTSLLNRENDIRHTLYPVFSAPLYGPSVFAAHLIPNKTAQGVIFALTNAAVLLASFLLLANILPRKERVFFLLFLAGGYASLLFCVMLEQYQTALFWTALFLHETIKRGRSSAALFIGSAGTLSLNAAFFPFLLINGKKFELKTAFDYFKKALFGSLLLLCLTANLRTIAQIGYVDAFSNPSVTSKSQLHQFVSFAASCFRAPVGQVTDVEGSGVKVWTQAAVTDFDRFGLAVLGLCLLGFALNAKDRLAAVSIYWVFISFLLIAVIGWGCSENGMVLYTLCFAWAYAFLIHLLLRKLFALFRLEYGLYAAEAAAAALLACYNLGSIELMIRAVKGLVSFTV